jgi:aspartyl-tRNA(Asn)/glutamyl-tRNA(Gln) amidotransferase subunit C
VIGTREVGELCALARLRLSEGEASSLRADLAALLADLAALRSVDTTGVEPMTHAVPLPCRLRGDEVAESLSVEAALGGAPARAGDLFVVPRVVGGDER